MRLILPRDVFGLNLFSEGTWFSDMGSAVTLILLLAGIVVVALRWWWWRTQEYLVTNRRLVLAWGVLNKLSSDSSLEKINDAQLEVTVVGRLLDYGTLKVLTAAPMAGSDYLDRLNHAKEFKKAIMTAKHDLQSGSGDGEDYMPALGPGAATGRCGAASTSRAARIRHERTRLTRSPPSWRSWPSCATRAASLRRSTRPRSRSCWGACDLPTGPWHGLVRGAPARPQGGLTEHGC